jgi:hypothetical protein
MEYQTALSKRSLPQVRSAEVITNRVKKAKVQEQKMLSILEKRHNKNCSNFFEALVQKLK